MNIWHTIVLKISHAVAAVLVFVGVSAAPVAPTTTVVDIDPQQPATTITVSSSGAAPVVSSTTTPPKTETVTETTTAPTPEPTPTPVPVYIIQQPAPAPEPAPAPTPIPEALPPQPKPHMTTLEIISPYPGKGTGREYLARPEIKDEANYIELGLLLRDENGENLKDLQVTVNATDESQNKTLNGTGNVTNIYPNGEKRQIYYYPFHYEFRTPGEHTITFTADGVTETITLQAPEDTRPN